MLSIGGRLASKRRAGRYLRSPHPLAQAARVPGVYLEKSPLKIKACLDGERAMSCTLQGWLLVVMQFARGDPQLTNRFWQFVQKAQWMT